MFTGIITDLGRFRGATRGQDSRFVFETRYETGSIDLGASIACAGVCLSVVDKGSGWFAADVSAETLARTTLGTWAPGTRVNLERSLRVGDELGGHLVTGHVDGVGEVLRRGEEGGSLRLAVSAPADLLAAIAPKGSVAVDGVSLTVNHIHDAPKGGHFEVNVIPHTGAATTLGAARAGVRVNLEIDLLARYVRRLIART